MNTVDLFGGAIVAPVKNTFLDASKFRQIPDTQEVFVDMTTQQSLIFELLEQVEANNEEVARYHFQQLAEDNDAAQSTVTSVHTLQPQDATPLFNHKDVEAYILQGTQRISKFNEENAHNQVEIILAVVRLTNVSTDFVISLNAPVKLASASSEQESVNETNAVSIDTVKQEMMTILKELNVKNWDLFG